jgi:hypothetical protein
LLIAQKKEDHRLQTYAWVMQEILQGNGGLPRIILNQFVCVLVYPTVKKVAIGRGRSYGRGALVC